MSTPGIVPAFDEVEEAPGAGSIARFEVTGRPRADARWLRSQGLTT